MTIRESIFQDNMTILNVYVWKNIASRSKFMRQKLIELQGEIEKSTLIVGCFNRTSTQKICKDIVELNSIINQMQLIDIYRIFHQRTAEHIFFSTSHWTFTKMCNFLDHETHFSTFKIRDMIQSMCSDHMELK